MHTHMHACMHACMHTTYIYAARSSLDPRWGDEALVEAATGGYLDVVECLALTPAALEMRAVVSPQLAR